MLLPLLLVTLLTCVAAFFLFRRSSSAASSSAAPAAAPAKKPAAKPAKVDITKKAAPSGQAAASAAGGGRKSSEARGGAHEEDALVVRHLRGHQGDITGMAVSPDGRHVATVGRDEQVRLWTVVEGVPNPHFARHNLKKGDYATAVAMSGPYVVIAIAETRQVQIFGIKESKEAGTATLTQLHAFPTPHKANITSLRMAANQQCIVTMAEGTADLNVYAFTPKGAVIATLSVAQLRNYSLALSPDSRFLIAGTKISDPKCWELVYRKDPKSPASSSAQSPEKVELAAVLKGHKRGVRSVAFGTATSRLVVTAATDGAFAEHTLPQRTHSSEEPRLRRRCQTDFSELTLIDVLQTDDTESPVVALAAGPTLQFWQLPVSEAAAPSVLATVAAPHKGPITALEFAKDAKLLFTAGENKAVTIWRLPKHE